MTHSPSSRLPGKQRRPQRESLEAALERSGFYPRLVADALAEGLDGRRSLSHLVHLETHFERSEVRRHVTVLALTEDTLLVAHVDEAPLDGEGKVSAQLSMESVPLPRIGSVVLSYVFDEPAQYRSGDATREVTLSVAWSGGQRLDLLPAGCSDPQCDSDHGYTGTGTLEDLVLRISAEAEGLQAVERAKDFARSLRTATAVPARGPGSSVPTARRAPSPRERLVAFGGRALRGHGAR